jgi:hypothetical protein
MKVKTVAIQTTKWIFLELGNSTPRAKIYIEEKHTCSQG